MSHNQHGAACHNGRKREEGKANQHRCKLEHAQYIQIRQHSRCCAPPARRRSTTCPQLTARGARPMLCSIPCSRSLMREAGVGGAGASGWLLTFARLGGSVTGGAGAGAGAAEAAPPRAGAASFVGGPAWMGWRGGGGASEVGLPGSSPASSWAHTQEQSSSQHRCSTTKGQPQVKWARLSPAASAAAAAVGGPAAGRRAGGRND